MPRNTRLSSSTSVFFFYFSASLFLLYSFFIFFFPHSFTCLVSLCPGARGVILAFAVWCYLQGFTRKIPVDIAIQPILRPIRGTPPFILFSASTDETDHIE